MPYVMAAPDMMTAAATDVAAVGSMVSAAHMAAAGPTVAVIPAAADEVSASIAHLFSGAAQNYQALAARASAFQEQFVQHLNVSARSYAAAEAAGAASLMSPASAAADLPGQLSNTLASFFNALPAGVTFIMNAIYGTALLGIIVAYFSLILAWLTVVYEIFLLEFQLVTMFGRFIPFPLP